MISITCQEARNILAAVSIPEDKLQALQYIKRYNHKNNRKMKKKHKEILISDEIIKMISKSHQRCQQPGGYGLHRVGVHIRRSQTVSG